MADTPQPEGQQLFSDRFYDEMWKDVREEESFPTLRPMLAHYTSVPVLEHHQERRVMALAPFPDE